MNDAFKGDTITSLEELVERKEPMTEVEFESVMDGLLRKGLIAVVKRADGELGFAATPAGKAALEATEKARAL